MSDILMVTSRHVVNNDGSVASGGDGTLIFRRAKAMKNILGLSTAILPLNGVVKNVDTGHFGSYFVPNNNVTKNIENHIKKHKPEIIILSGEKSYIYEKKISKTLKEIGLNSSIILDIHGALEEGIEHAKGLRFIRSFMKYQLKKMFFKKYSKKANGIMFVTDELRDHYYKMLSRNQIDKLVDIKIRCGVEEIITNEHRLRWRKNIREKWGIDDDTIVFVYSGYRWAWQKVDETIELFERFNTNIKKSFFVLLTNSDPEFEEKLKEKFPKNNYYVGLLPASEVKKYLCACDVGMLIREDNYTNNVAFPNKFSDYINSGLSLVISDSLKEPVRILKKYNFPYLEVNFPELKVSTLDPIYIRQKNVVEFYNLCNEICQNELDYDYQIKQQIRKFQKLRDRK